MNIDVNEEKRMIKIWLTKADQKDVDIMRQVDEICAKSKANNVQAVIYRSGEGDLKEGTLDLLIRNKRIQAEQMQKEEKQKQHARQYAR